MRKLLAGMALFVLASCFSVNGTNVYWDKGYLDPALEGTWQYVDEKPYDQARKWRFTRHDDVYKLDGFVADTGLANGRPVDVRSLKIGKYTYAMARMEKDQWLLVRYDVRGKNARELLPNKEALIVWLKEHNAKLGSVELSTDSPQDITIKTFDDEAFQLLSMLPDGEDYWNSFAFRKVKQ